MKRKNFNAVRCSHYPNAFHLYDMANEIGLYVCDEGNIETHGFTLSSTFSLLACLPEWKNLFLSRVQSMARRSINYPCVIIHSLGNESGNGPNLEACSAWLREFDPTRPVQYEGGRDHENPHRARGKAGIVLLTWPGRQPYGAPAPTAPPNWGAHPHSG